MIVNTETINGCFNIDGEWFISTMEGNKYQLCEISPSKHVRLERDRISIDKGIYDYDTEDFTIKWKFIELAGETGEAIIKGLVQIRVAFHIYHGDLPDKPSYTYTKDTNHFVPIQPQQSAISRWNEKQLKIILGCDNMNVHEIKQECSYLMNRIQRDMLTERSNKDNVQRLEAYQYALKTNYPYV